LDKKIGYLLLTACALVFISPNITVAQEPQPKGEEPQINTEFIKSLPPELQEQINDIKFTIWFTEVLKNIGEPVSLPLKDRKSTNELAPGITGSSVIYLSKWPENGIHMTPRSDGNITLELKNASEAWLVARSILPIKYFMEYLKLDGVINESDLDRYFKVKQEMAKYLPLGASVVRIFVYKGGVYLDQPEVDSITKFLS